MFDLSEAGDPIFHKILAQAHFTEHGLGKVSEFVRSTAPMPGSVVSSVSALVERRHVASPPLRFRSACRTGKSSTSLHDRGLSVTGKRARTPTRRASAPYSIRRADRQSRFVNSQAETYLIDFCGALTAMTQPRCAMNLASPDSEFVQCSSEHPYCCSVYLVTQFPHPSFWLHGDGADQECSRTGTIDTDFSITRI